LAVHSPDPASVEQLRRGYLSRYDGPLDRPDWWLPFEWDVGEGGEHKYSYGWSEADVLTGFLRYQQSRPSGPWMHIDVRELIASTGNAMRGLLSLLAGHEAQSPQVVFRHSSLPPRSDLLYLIPDADRAISIQGRLCWMQRIVDLREAVLARGWATHANTEVELEVVDPVRESRERVVLQLSEGHGYVSPGGNGNVHCDVGALSAWYSGTLRASDAERLGLFRGRADDIAVMDTLIGDRQPWMPDFF